MSDVWFCWTLGQRLTLSIILFCCHSTLYVRSLIDCHAVCDSALSWLQSYLDNRTQFVFDNLTADFVLDCSVPQSSVLGPLLFIFYTAEVTEMYDRDGDSVSSVR